MTAARFNWQAALAACVTALVLAGCGGGSDPDATAEAQAAGRAAALAGPAQLAPAPQADASVTGLVKVSEKRIGRTVFEYVFRISLQGGSTAMANATAQLTAVGPGTTIVDGTVLVGNLPAGGSVEPADTITLRHDRLLLFQPGALVWSITGGGATPASIELALSQNVVGAGAPVQLLPTVRDANGAVISPAPPITFELLVPPDGTAGTVPTLAAAQVSTAATTRGGFGVRATVAGTGLTATARFTVVKNLMQAANSGLHATFSAAQGEMERQLARALRAEQAGDAAALAAARAAILSAAATVNTDRMSFTTAFAPDAGFIPTTAKLSANGYAATAADAAYGTASTQLRNKIAQLTSLLKQPSGNDAADTALLAQYRNELATIVATLQSPAARPTIFGLVQHADNVSSMLALQMPQLLKAMALRVAAQVPVSSAPPKVALRGGQVSPQLIGGLLDALGPIGKLVNSIYGDYLEQIERMAVILAAQGLLDALLTQTATIHGVLAGAALLGPYAYNYPNSYIDMGGISLAAAQSADVYLIGGAAVAALQAAGQALPPPSNPQSMQDVFDYFDGVVEAINGVGQAYDDAHQQPSSVVANSFDNFGCLPSLSDFCIELRYPNGFKNVSGGSVSFTVLMLVRTGGPRPQYGSRVFNFAPGT